jgi:hypothetical protein
MPMIIYCTKNTNTIKKNTKAFLDANKVVGLEVNAEGT